MEGEELQEDRPHVEAAPDPDVATAEPAPAEPDWGPPPTQVAPPLPPEPPFPIHGPRGGYPICGLCERPVRKIEVEVGLEAIAIRVTCHGRSIVVIESLARPAQVEDWSELPTMPDSPR